MEPVARILPAGRSVGNRVPRPRSLPEALTHPHHRNTLGFSLPRRPARRSPEMRWRPPIFLAGLLAAVPLLLRSTEARPDEPKDPDTAGPAFAKDVRPLLKTYCFECHNATKRKAGLNLEQFDTDAAALDAVELWTQVGERLQAQEMPPPNRKQPTDDDRRRSEERRVGKECRSRWWP